MFSLARLLIPTHVLCVFLLQPTLSGAFSNHLKPNLLCLKLEAWVAILNEWIAVTSLRSLHGKCIPVLIPGEEVATQLPP